MCSALFLIFYSTNSVFALKCFFNEYQSSLHWLRHQKPLMSNQTSPTPPTLFDPLPLRFAYFPLKKHTNLCGCSFISFVLSSDSQNAKLLAANNFGPEPSLRSGLQWETKAFCCPSLKALIPSSNCHSGLSAFRRQIANSHYWKCCCIAQPLVGWVTLEQLIVCIWG